MRNKNEIFAQLEVTEKLILMLNEENAQKNYLNYFQSPSTILYHYIWYNLSNKANQPTNWRNFLAIPIPFWKRKFFAISTFSAFVYILCTLLHCTFPT